LAMENREDAPADLAVRSSRGAIWHAIRARARKLGLRRPSSDLTLARDRVRTGLMHECGVSVGLDVGANEGLFALRLRAAGYTGRIVSFEPLSEMFAKLDAASADDPLWECMHVALGSRAGRTRLNVAGNWLSSSLLPMNPRHRLAAPRSAYVGMQEVEISTLDNLSTRFLRADDRAYLKLDVQGSELDVLEGAERTLRQVEVLDVELSVLPLYDGAPLLSEVVAYLDDRRFRLVAIEPGFRHPETNAILQLEGLFARVETT
jgi:FkbM family methyltransferase